MLIGAHVSSSGGTIKCIERATALGIRCFQTFLSAPQSYRFTAFDQEKTTIFHEAKKKSKITYSYVHAIYLLNFASDKPHILALSKSNLIQTLSASSTLGFDGVVIHLGSTNDTLEKGLVQVANYIAQVLEETPKESCLYLENSAGAGNLIGSHFEHLETILELNKNNPRLKVCLDTQHMFASGYDIVTNPEKIIMEAKRRLGTRIQLIHLNDSKSELNSHKDRHENIGKGHIGYDALKRFCIDSTFKDIPYILEVPGFNNEGPDIKNIEIVKTFIK